MSVRFDTFDPQKIVQHFFVSPHQPPVMWLVRLLQSGADYGNP
jgi:hypothetical protein